MPQTQSNVNCLNLYILALVTVAITAVAAFVAVIMMMLVIIVFFNYGYSMSASIFIIAGVTIVRWCCSCSMLGGNVDSVGAATSISTIALTFVCAADRLCI
jgi:hypothetical protein